MGHGPRFLSLSHMHFDAWILCGRPACPCRRCGVVARCQGWPGLRGKAGMASRNTERCLSRCSTFQNTGVVVPARTNASPKRLSVPVIHFRRPYTGTKVGSVLLSSTLAPCSCPCLQTLTAMSHTWSYEPRQSSKRHRQQVLHTSDGLSGPPHAARRKRRRPALLESLFRCR